MYNIKVLMLVTKKKVLYKSNENYILDIYTSVLKLQYFQNKYVKSIVLVDKKKIHSINWSKLYIYI